MVHTIPVPGSSAPRALATEVEILKAQLNLTGSMKKVVEEAALQLGINFKGRPLRDVSIDCVSALGGQHEAICCHFFRGPVVRASGRGECNQIGFVRGFVFV